MYSTSRKAAVPHMRALGGIAGGFFKIKRGTNECGIEDSVFGVHIAPKKY